jgi:predicted transcriptional regulator
LQQIEEKSGGIRIVEIDLTDYTPLQVSYHIMQLHQAGFIKAHDTTTTAGFSWEATTLTWEGHEFLDAIRSDTVWKKIKDTVKEKGVEMPFAILKSLALKLAGGLFGV